jgi:hypothetical protein
MEVSLEVECRVGADINFANKRVAEFYMARLARTFTEKRK